MVSFYLDRPLNFAHRGAEHEAPANTLVAFERAAALGADGIELDAQLTKDGEVVVIHDYALESTTDGRGLVAAKTLAELKELDAGSWFAPAFAGHQIPTLQEVIDAVGDRLLLNIELKTNSLRDDGLPAAVVRRVEENGLCERVILSSFNPVALRRLRQLNPGIPAGLLYSTRGSPFVRWRWLRAWVQPGALHPCHTLVDDTYVQWAKGQGYRVNVWAVKDADEMRRVVALGVDVIITSRPEILGQVLAAHEGQERDR
jgi:glycerophosphoryl diester phosphodiesterase